MIVNSITGLRYTRTPFYTPAALPIPSQVYVWQVQSASRQKFSSIQGTAHREVTQACAQRTHIRQGFDTSGCVGEQSSRVIHVRSHGSSWNNAIKLWDATSVAPSYIRRRSHSLATRDYRSHRLYKRSKDFKLDTISARQLPCAFKGLV